MNSLAQKSVMQDDQTGLSSSVEKHLRRYFAVHEEHRPISGLYDIVLQEVERPLLQVVLSECQGNQLKAAALLGLNRNTLRKKMKQLGLLPKRARRIVKRVS